jgi:Type II secretion system (T2SS), protein M subtype b
MIDELSARQRRLMAVSLLMALMLLLWGAVVNPLSRFIQTRGEDRQADIRALSRDRALLASDPQIKGALTALSQSPRLIRLYDGPKADKAVLQLESDLRALINTPNNPTSMAATPAVTNGALTRIAVKVTLSMPIDQFAGVLSRLENHSKLLLIDNITIQAPDFQAANTNPALAIQAEVTGFMVSPKEALK